MLFDILLKLRKGSIHKSKNYETYPCKEVIIKKSNIKAHSDGEPLNFYDLAKIEIFPKSLRVLIP